jgi:hypothetical protein
MARVQVAQGMTNSKIKLGFIDRKLGFIHQNQQLDFLMEKIGFFLALFHMLLLHPLQCFFFQFPDIAKVASIPRQIST